jgi:hypothetical protein
MEYWDKEYPTHIEVPEGYWVCSYNVEWEDGRNKDENQIRQNR